MAAKKKTVKGKAKPKKKPVKKVEKPKAKGKAKPKPKAARAPKISAEAAKTLSPQLAQAMQKQAGEEAEPEPVEVAPDVPTVVPAEAKVAKQTPKPAPVTAAPPAPPKKPVNNPFARPPEGASSPAAETQRASAASQPAAPAPAPSAPVKDDVVQGELSDDNVPLEKRNLRLYVIGIVLSVVVVAITIGVFVSRTRTEVGEGEVASPEVSEEADTLEAPPELTGEEEEEEEEVVVLDREDISLEILNGSGIAGKAGETADIFEDLGYEIADIGNADSTEGNELYISGDYSEEEVEALLDDVQDELGIEEVTDVLEDLDATARIVIGE